MANTDLRYRRTERFLFEAFGAALRERPLEKITVTALASAADINKATFYLHYRDIYDLAEAYVGFVAEQRVARMDYLADYFDDPRRFVEQLVSDFKSSKEEGLVFGRNGLVRPFIDALATAMHARLRELKPIHDDKRGSMMTRFVLNGILGLLPHYEDDFATVVQVAGDALTAIGDQGKAKFPSALNA